MHVTLLLALLMGTPYWEKKQVKEMNDEELMGMVQESPWGQTTLFQNGSPMAVYLATSKPMREAEAEMMRRYSLRRPQPAPVEGPSAREEYETFLRENDGKVIVIAILNPSQKAISDAAEMRHLEENSALKVGKKKWKMTGHFPPASTDPVLRLVFPRPEELGKEIAFDLYLPGATGPYRQIVFKIKDLMYRGKLEL